MNIPTNIVTRFAPSPNGFLHLGHGFSSWVAKQVADAGHYHVRIEDIDRQRARPEFYTAIMTDLAAVGLEASTPRVQSKHAALQAWALEQLKKQDVLYPCFCTRKDIDEALDAPQDEQTNRPYPGICRNRSHQERLALMDENIPHAWRLDLEKALTRLGAITFREWGFPPFGPAGDIKVGRDVLLRKLGDVVVARKDIGTSYHLAVVLCDAAQNITHVTRGNDLFLTTPIQVILQKLLNLPVPDYFHHQLVQDADGRLAKRKGSTSLRDLLEEGIDIWQELAPLMDKARPCIDELRAARKIS